MQNAPMRYSVLLVLCAVGLADLAEAQRPIIVRSLMGRGRVLSDTMGTPYTVPYPAEAVFHALPAVYESLKIPPEVRDSAMQAVGNQGFDRRVEVAGRRISGMMQCGSGADGDYADYYKISLSLITFVTPVDANSSTVRSVFLGSATTGTARGTRECRSNGELERRIQDLVKRQLDK